MNLNSLHRYPKGNIAYIAEDIISISMKRLFYSILLICLVTSCSIRDVRNQLKDVESYIAERPDSALAVIESIDSTVLRTKGLQAHHALLHAMALDKNYIDVKDDSLALTAVRYYQKHGHKKYLARARYYLALSYFNAKQYDESIVELAKAESVAEKYDSLYWGFVKALQADIYNINYNSIQELYCLEEALKIYSEINATYYVDVTKLGLARSYIDNDQYNQAEKLLTELINSNRLNKRIRYQAIMSYAFMLATQPEADYSSATFYFDKVASEAGVRFFTTQDYWVWAYALFMDNQEQESKKIEDQLKQIDTSGTAYYWMYRLAKRRADYDNALTYLEKNNQKDNNHISQILKQSISSTQRDYYRSQYDIAKYKATNRLLIIIVVITIVIATMIIAVFSINRYKSKKEFEKQEYIRYAEEINRQLRELQKDSYTSLQKRYVSMYKSRYETLRALYERYTMSDGRTDADKIMYREVTRLIDELRHDIKDSKVLERMLDDDLDGLLSTLRNEIPALTRKDHTLIGYLALGFDVVMTSHFMNCSPNSIYIRKSRLKKTIEESGAEHKDVFLEIIG